MLGGPTIGTAAGLDIALGTIWGGAGGADGGGGAATRGGGGAATVVRAAALSYIMTMLWRREPRAIHFTTCITKKNTRNATDTVSTK